MLNFDFFVFKPHFSKKGFTFLELVVVVAISMILSSAAIVSYSSYVAAARKSSMKTDLINMHKGVQSFTYMSNNFCKNHLEGDSECNRAVSFESINMSALLLSGIYGVQGKKPNFIGFAAVSGGCDHGAFSGQKGENFQSSQYVAEAPAPVSICNMTAPGRKLVIGVGANKNNSLFNRDRSCKLSESDYIIGAFGFYKKNTWIGMNIDDENFFDIRDDENSGAAPAAVHTQYVKGDGSKNAPCALPSP